MSRVKGPTSAGANSPRDFDEMFRRATQLGEGPFPFQRELALAEELPDVLNVPTGLGKTAGVVLAWMWRRCFADNAMRQATPTRLVYCLPMRVLVEQTAESARTWVKRLEAWLPDSERPAVHVMMGGDVDDEWVRNPERPCILVGTQDMLLSRALNRGYGMSPFRWPQQFGLLNNDCFWVFDEVQLMGPGAWTSAQLDWMRRSRFDTILPCRSLWMSATVGEGFLSTSDRRDAHLDQPVVLGLGQDDLANNAAARRLRAMRPVAWFVPTKTTAGRKGAASSRAGGKKSKANHAPSAESLAQAVYAAHDPGTLSLVVCNTVTMAQAVYAALPTDAPKVLLTSRFRQADRQAAESRVREFEQRRREHVQGVPGPGLVCVSTQVVEAGMDISARRLWSELAPWPSLVQRLGRLNRDGLDDAHAVATLWEPGGQESLKEEKDRIGPYRKADLNTARRLVEDLIPLSSRLPAHEALRNLATSALAQKALKIEAAPYPRAVDVHGLFSNERDVHGGFTDVSPFVRDPNTSPDVHVLWRHFDRGQPMAADLDGPPQQSTELCAVPVWALRQLMNTGAEAYTWNAEARGWQRLQAAAVRPGMTIMLPDRAGGYSPDLGWTGSPEDKLLGLPPPGPGWGDYQSEVRSESLGWVPLSAHLRDAEQEARRLASALHLKDSFGRALIAAAANHDTGKAHPKWHKGMVEPNGTPSSEIWAKFPQHLAIRTSSGDAPRAVERALEWLQRRNISATVVAARESTLVAARRLSAAERAALGEAIGARVVAVGLRSGLRHEVASALAMMHRYVNEDVDYPLLSVYLVAAHHGKARTHLRCRKGDDVCGVPRDSQPLPWQGGLPMDFGSAADGTDGDWTESGFVIRVPGWTGIVSDLLGPAFPGQPWDTGSVPAAEARNLGPFRLAYLESLMIAADWRSSATPSEVRNVG